MYVCMYMCMSDGTKHCVVLSYNSSRDNAGQPAKSSSENSSFVSSYGHELGTVGSVVETPYGQPLLLTASFTLCGPLLFNVGLSNVQASVI